MSLSASRGVEAGVEGSFFTRARGLRRDGRRTWRREAEQHGPSPTCGGAESSQLVVKYGTIGLCGPYLRSHRKAHKRAGTLRPCRVTSALRSESPARPPRRGAPSMDPPSPASRS